MFNPFPDDMREVTLTRHEVFIASLKAAHGILICIALFLLIFPSGYMVWQNGFIAFQYFGDWFWVVTQPMIGLLAVWIAAVCFITWNRVGRLKTLGIPVRYGVDADTMFCVCELLESKMLWKSFIAWAETDKFFLLHDGNRRNLLPKYIWTPEEVSAIRGCLREKVQR